MAAITSKRLGAYKGLRFTSALLLVLVLIQAALAGRGLSFGGNWIDFHGGVAELTLLTALAQMIVVFAARLGGRFKTRMIVTNVLLFVLVVVQFGLGWGGRSNATAASLHIPNGVLIFGVATFAACLAWLNSPASERTA